MHSKNISVKLTILFVCVPMQRKIDFAQIKELKKSKTMMIFEKGITAMVTDGSTHEFHEFQDRDLAFANLCKVWHSQSQYATDMENYKTSNSRERP